MRSTTGVTRLAVGLISAGLVASWAVQAAAQEADVASAVPSTGCGGFLARCPDLTVEIRGLPSVLDLSVRWTFSVVVRNASHLVPAKVPKGTHLLGVTMLGYEDFAAPDGYWCSNPVDGNKISNGADCVAIRDDNIAPSGERTFNFTVEHNPGPSKTTVEAAVDTMGVIQETDENNNAASQSYSVEGADISVVAVGSLCGASKLPFGASATCDYKVVNAGPDGIYIGAGSPVIGVGLGNSAQTLQAPTGFKLERITASRGISCTTLHEQLSPVNEGATLCRAVMPLRIAPGQLVAEVVASLIAVGEPPGPGFGMEVDICALISSDELCSVAGGSVGD